MERPVEVMTKLRVRLTAVDRVCDELSMLLPLGPDDTFGDVFARLKQRYEQNYPDTSRWPVDFCKMTDRDNYDLDMRDRVVDMLEPSGSQKYPDIIVWRATIDRMQSIPPESHLRIGRKRTLTEEETVALKRTRTEGQLGDLDSTPDNALRSVESDTLLVRPSSSSRKDADGFMIPQAPASASSQLRPASSPPVGPSQSSAFPLSPGDTPPTPNGVDAALPDFANTPRAQSASALAIDHTNAPSAQPAATPAATTAGGPPSSSSSSASTNKKSKTWSAREDQALRDAVPLKLKARQIFDQGLVPGRSLKSIEHRLPDIKAKHAQEQANATSNRPGRARQSAATAQQPEQGTSPVTRSAARSGQPARNGTQAIYTPLTADEEGRVREGIRNRLGAPLIKSRHLTSRTLQDVMHQIDVVKKIMEREDRDKRARQYRDERIRLENESRQPSSSTGEEWKQSEDDMILAARLLGLQMTRVASKRFPRRDEEEVTKRSQMLYRKAEKRAKRGVTNFIVSGANVLAGLQQDHQDRIRAMQDVVKGDRENFQTDRASEGVREDEERRLEADARDGRHQTKEKFDQIRRIAHRVEERNHRIDYVRTQDELQEELAARGPALNSWGRPVFSSRLATTTAPRSRRNPSAHHQASGIDTLPTTPALEAGPSETARRSRADTEETEEIQVQSSQASQTRQFHQRRPLVMRPEVLAVLNREEAAKYGERLEKCSEHERGIWYHLMESRLENMQEETRKAELIVQGRLASSKSDNDEEVDEEFERADRMDIDTAGTPRDDAEEEDDDDEEEEKDDDDEDELPTFDPTQPGNALPVKRVNPQSTLGSLRPSMPSSGKVRSTIVTQEEVRSLPSPDSQRIDTQEEAMDEYFDNELNGTLGSPPTPAESYVRPESLKDFEIPRDDVIAHVFANGERRFFSCGTGKWTSTKSKSQGLDTEPSSNEPEFRGREVMLDTSDSGPLSESSFVSTSSELEPEYRHLDAEAQRLEQSQQLEQDLQELDSGIGELEQDDHKITGSATVQADHAHGARRNPVRTRRIMHSIEGSPSRGSQHRPFMDGSADDDVQVAVAGTIETPVTGPFAAPRTKKDKKSKARSSHDWMQQQIAEGMAAEARNKARDRELERERQEVARREQHIKRRQFRKWRCPISPHASDSTLSSMDSSDSSGSSSSDEDLATLAKGKRPVARV